MILTSGHSPVVSPLRQGRTTRRAAAAGLTAAILLLAAACSSGGGSGGGSSTGSGGGSSTGSGGGSGSAPLSPKQALTAAAARSEQVNSAVETLNVTGAGASTTGTIQVQLKPALELSAVLDSTAAGQKTQIKEIITGSALYLSTPALSTAAGKPWVKVDLSALNGTAAASFAQLVHSLQSDSFANQAQLLAVAPDTHFVGNQTVDGVATTEYAGSIKASAALSALSPAMRKVLSPELSLLGSSTIMFHIWIDGQHDIRKLAEVETVSGQTVNTTVTISDINQPVSIALPPASQVGSAPGL